MFRVSLNSQAALSSERAFAVLVTTHDKLSRQHRVSDAEGVVDRRNDHANTKLTCHSRLSPAWNKGRIVGQKKSLLPKHVWTIRVRLEIVGNHRDLALFNLAIDSKLRGCDLVTLKVADVFAAGQMKERAPIIQSKTQKSVRFEITDGTRKSLDSWMDEPLMIGSEFL